MCEYKYMVDIDTPETEEGKQELENFIDPLVDTDECRANNMYYTQKEHGLIIRPGYHYMFWFKSKDIAQTLVDKYGIFAGVQEVKE